MEYIVISLFYILFAFLAWKNFKLAIYGTLLLLPSYRMQFSLFYFPFNLLSGVIWLLVFIFFIKKRKEFLKIFKNFLKIIGRHNNVFSLFRWPIILILFSAFLSSFFVNSSSASLGLLKSYFLEAIFFFILLVFNFNKKDFKISIYFLQILVYLIFAVAFYQKFSANFIFNTTNILEQGRVTTLFGYPNANGLILLPIFFLSLLNLFQDKKIFLKIFNILTLILSFLVIYWAKSESAIVAIIVSLLLFVLFKIIKNKKFIFTISFLVLLSSLFLPFILKAPLKIDEPGTKKYTFQQKILLKDLSGQIRRQMWKESIDFIKDYPMQGAGLGAYQEKIKPYHQNDYIEIFLYPHNIWLNFWISLGMLGLLAFLSLSILLIVRLSQNLSMESLILLIGFLAIIIQGAVEVPYFKNDLSIIWWLFLAGHLIYVKK